MSDDNELPMGWATAELNLVATIVRGISFPSNAKRLEPQDGDIACLRTANVQREVDWEDLWFVNREFVRRQEQFLQTNDILISTANSYELVGKVSLVRHVPRVASLGAFISLIRTGKCSAPKFVYHQLESFTVVNQLREMASTTTNISNISSGKLQHLSLRIAPLNEQRRIVAKIEELFSDLDSGVAALKRAKANLKRYRAAVLKAAVEGKLTEEWRAKHPAKEPASALLARILTERREKWEADQLAKFAAAGKEPPKNWRDKYIEPSPPDTSGLPELPDNWCWAKLDQILTYLRNGYFQSPTGANSGTPILRINAVRPMKVDLAETRFLDEIEGSVDEYFIANGDLLFTRYNGSVDLLGVAGMVRGCTEKVLHPDKLIRVKLALGEPLPSFVEVAANVGASRIHMAGRARTTAGQKGISGHDVREMPIPLPPLVEQQHIVTEVAERLSQIDAAEMQIDHGLLRAARLRQSILKQAFEGKLVPQDPSDEPASVLLERLRAQQSIKGENRKAGNSTRTFGRGAKSKKIERRVAE